MNLVMAYADKTIIKPIIAALRISWAFLIFSWLPPAVIQRRPAQITKIKKMVPVKPSTVDNNLPIKAGISKLPFGSPSAEVSKPDKALLVPSEARACEIKNKLPSKV